MDAIGTAGAHLAFATLDRAARMVFDYLVREKETILREELPQLGCFADEARVRSEIGKHVYDGFIVGRTLLGTHKIRLQFSGDVEDSQNKGREMIDRLSPMKAQDLLYEAGEKNGLLLQNWGWANYRGRLFEQIFGVDKGAMMTYAISLDGFVLSISEDIQARKSRDRK